MNAKTIKYAGFWIRFTASMIDSILILAVILPILVYVYGTNYFFSTDLIQGYTDFLVTWVAPFIAVIIFWRFKSATPGKMIFRLIIVDADTLGRPSNKQLLIRYLGYFVSTIPLCLGFLWIAFDKRKQAWHDKMANTVVIKDHA